MATYTNIINSVMRRLREDQITGPSDTEYSLLIGELVNETKREVEDAWKWTALRSTKTIATVAGTTQYAITGAGNRWKLQDAMNSVYNLTETYCLSRRPAVWMKEQIIANTDQGKPGHYYFEGADSNGDPYVNIWLAPDAAYTINFNLVVPQDDFSVGTEVLSVPDYPVMLGAYAKAIAERGEDDGRAHGEALSKYGQALGDAIAIDESLTTGETTWYA
jgi:hypothetical protein